MAKRITPDGRYINSIAHSIKDFERGLPSLERGIMDDFTDLVRRLDFDFHGWGKKQTLRPNVANMRKLNKFSKEFREIVVQSGWGNKVTEMQKNIQGIEAAGFNYFDHVSKTIYDPSTFSSAIKNETINSLKSSLLGSGLDANIVTQAQKIVNQSITEGVTFAALQKQMSDFIVGTGNGGRLQRYSRQIVTDSLNQYAAQLNKTFTDDLNLQWYRYVGSLVDDSRPWCLAMVGKEWIHSSELPAATRGDIDGRSVPLTGLMPGTNATNVQVRRGGYNCNHMLLPVADEAVPMSLRAKFDKSLADKAAKKAARQEKMQKSSRAFGKKWGYKPDNLTEITKGAKVDDDVFKQLSLNTRLMPSKSGSNYTSSSNIVKIDTVRYDKGTVSKAIYHEFGHAAHHQRKWLYPEFDLKKGKSTHFVVPEIDDVFKKWRKKLGYGTKYTPAKGQMLTELQDKISHRSFMDFQASRSISPNVAGEDWGAMHDVVGALTNGRYGGGHSKKYYNMSGGYGAKAEFVAHAFEFKYRGNPAMQHTFPELYQDMINMLDKLISLP